MINSIVTFLPSYQKPKLYLPPKKKTEKAPHLFFIDNSQNACQQQNRRGVIPWRHKHTLIKEGTYS